MYKKYYLGFILFVILILCLSIYWVGLKGDFLFDDYPNLEDLGTYGIIDSWDKAKNFISNGFSGPTGRPISLASFLIDANTWPADPFSFKYTNLMIHLLNGLLLCWAIVLLLRSYNYKEEKAIWIALLATSIWLLHPYFVSTTLYIVQRMAQLATLFSLVGIIGYLKARQELVTSPHKSYLFMLASIGICTILATYSKENGALLPLLILIIEFCNPCKDNKPNWKFRALCLWLPSIAFALLLIHYMNFSENPWPNRNFNMIERLYSEARIVSEYLFNLYVPQIELRGLYQDGYNISKSLLDPITTISSIIFLILLFIVALILRKKFPLFSLAVLFFFAAHLMESTVIGLELYFEHRNYLAALFLFLPFSSGLYGLKEKIDPKFVYLIIIIMLSILSFFTYERAKLWGNTDKLQDYWARNTPNSPRAQNAIAASLLDRGYINESNQFLEQAIIRLPDSALLNMRLLLQKVYYNLATEKDFKETSQKMLQQPFDAQAIQALRTLVEYIVEYDKAKEYGDLSIEFIKLLETQSVYKNIPLFQRLTPYLKAKLYLAENNNDSALKLYILAADRYNDVEAGLMMVAEIGSAKDYQKALILLNHVTEIYHSQDKSKLRRSSREYDYEIKRLHEILTNKLKGNQIEN
ncbi:tetratricopeptide repeat protein [Acinetobacter sp. Marseille-Q1623]|uniref:tetratricopeptide repeat protein n=1 Tax=Acinetobacter sp. Marseille-Q1623 TaxID=2697501 RepID=UPI00157B1403|nr:tetratricopeptide repeat protein [Acinetobacter sp. Marseille-Q1623]